MIIGKNKSRTQTCGYHVAVILWCCLLVVFLKYSHAEDKVPTEKQLQELEQQADQLEKEQAEAKRKAEEEARKKAEVDAKKKLEEAQAKAAAEEEKSKAAEQAKQEAEEEARKKAEEETQRVLEEEQKKHKLVWTVTNFSGRRIELRFFSKDRNWTWPGGNQVYVLDDVLSHTYESNCNYLEKICFGASASDGYYGVGPNNDQGCNDCCAQCGSEKTINLQ